MTTRELSQRPLLSCLGHPAIMRRRTRTTLLVAAIVIALLGALAYLRQKAPPEVARLLPESDGMLYINFEPLRAAMHFDQHPVQRDVTSHKKIFLTKGYGVV